MRYHLDLTNEKPGKVYPLGEDFSGESPSGERLSFNNFYMERNGKPFFPVSGEFHYSRMEPDRWEDELIKMRMGGINVIATYLFWNHIEEEEGAFDFTGRRDLRRFVELCAKHGLYVILRVGPFDHGEVRNGGLPDWLYGKPFQVRTTDPGFLAYVRRLYEKIGEQTQGLYYQDGGPVIGVQLDNEYMHSSAMWEMTTGISNEWVFMGDEGEKYILALRDIALESGLTPAFFTGTAWGGAAYSPRVLPLWGGYAYRPWLFYSRQGEHPATEEYVYQDYHRNGVTCTDDFTPEYTPESRPYACCEMGAGMMCCYNYRFIYPYRSVDALANIKVGSGCNFIGYYMFQGGTNPLGKQGAYLNEAQVPKRSYDYQAALGEFGQIRESYSRLKSIHFFTRFFGDRLAPMETALPEGASQINPRNTETLRFAVRTDGESGFLFVNNFQDHLTMPEIQHQQVQIETASGVYDIEISMASEENAILPFHFDLDGILLRQANAQPVLRTEIGGRTTYVFLVPEGMDGAFQWDEGVTVLGDSSCPQGTKTHLVTVRQGTAEVDLLLISREMANRLFLLRDGSLVFTDAALLEDEKGRLRLETRSEENILFCYPPERLGTPVGQEGPLGVVRRSTAAVTVPVQTEPVAPQRYVIRFPEGLPAQVKDVILQIDYEGDIGSLFLGNQMVHDNFSNLDTWEFGLQEHAEVLQEQPLTLYIAPIREGAKVHVESAMAARNEEARSLIAELKNVRTQPVYEIEL
ncbi:MAG: beta-galactosidase [Clostridia bacterium]|nr:beta-galactosidase [Clostridia bacterium]MBQ9212245.1 beta-galactosidase [Clostridia bacterium]